MKKPFIITSFLLLIFGCSQSQYKVGIEPVKTQISDKERSNYYLLTGKWFGSIPLTNGGHRYWTIQRNIDGSYQIDCVFINNSNNVFERSCEIGEWGTAGPVYFSIYKGDLVDGKFISSDPTDPHNKDAYKIISVNEYEFIYQGLSSGTIFKVTKVNTDFKLPISLPQN